ncbi:site-2 protease family protein [Pannus brasiliensis CCIBt3594]|uniref:Zinc metalloprotease n=1 Tax=Pannus brasiliensis CCIBt3594 TaxID=1427578 RepID=A0AAW9R1D1_9CHRO
MRANWRIGSLFGIPFYINSSWFLILAFFTLLNATDERIQRVAGDIPYLAWSIGFGISLLLFLSVLLHELGHSLTARSQGIEVNSITLFLFGGLASIDRESRTPNEALRVAIAGPTVSFLLFGALSLTDRLFNLNPIASYMVSYLAEINLFLGLFNLIPGLPLDGGQILKAIVWKATGDRFTGIRWAGVSGQAIGWLGILIGIVLVLLTGDVTGAWFGLIGWFVLRNATAYRNLTNLQESLLSLTADGAMKHNFRVLNAHQTIGEFIAEYIQAKDAASTVYFAASEGRYRGLIRVGDVQGIDRSAWGEKQLLEIARPLTEIPTVGEKTPLVDAVRKLEAIEDRSITVLTPAGAVAGVIDRGDIVEYLAKERKIVVQEADIRRAKSEGIYPSYLPLDEIAKALEKNDRPKIGEPSLLSGNQG